MRYVNAGANSQAIGTPADIADRMEELFMTGAADGFAITPAVLPTSLSDFATLVVPELQRRGLFRKHYEGATLRENLGLARPNLARQEASV
jgi:alkanesulfonate monooxygenase SsuD/methylene tetrahydromethanopterin reductase-like flavin-dependent oxidoreductase (luciferase family)